MFCGEAVDVAILITASSMTDDELIADLEKQEDRLFDKLLADAQE